MRTVTGAETTVLNSAHFATFARVLVEDADGTYQDLTNQDSIDWVHSGRIAQTIDQIVATGDFTFWRKQEGGNSLAPLDEASLLNRDIVPAYAPLIDVGRGIRCDFATIAIGASPGGSDWKRVFTGVIDRWNVEDDFVLVSARDAIGAEIADRWIEAETDYGTGPGRAIEDVMQDILTAWTTGITLYTPASPSFLVTTYTQQRSSVMDALQQLAALVGWVIQPKWDDGTSAYRLTFYEPDRAPASTDWTWADNRYEAIPDFALDRLHIRNALSLWYTNTSGVRTQVTASDATSITNYDRQWMEIEEPDDSPIDTATEAQDMIDAALLDLKDPIANQEMKTFCFWPVQLSDYFQFNGNAVHYSANQAFGITGFRHEFGGGHIDTFIRTRGKPAGFIKPWIARGNVVAPSSSVTTFRQASAPTATQIGDLWIDSDDGDRLYRWSGSAWVDVQDGDIGQALTGAAQGPFVRADPDQSGSTGLLDITIEDPELKITAIEQQQKSDSGGYGGTWLTGWDRSTGTIGVSTTLTRGEDISLIGKHNASIKVRVIFKDPNDVSQTWQFVHTFDADDIAELTGLEIGFDDEGKIRINWKGDEDWTTGYVTARGGSAPSDPTPSTNHGDLVGRTGSLVLDGTGSTTRRTAAMGEEVFVKVLPESGGTVVGPFKRRRGDAEFIPPRVEAEFDRDAQGNATLRLIVTDPSGAIVSPGPEYSKRAGSQAGDTWGSFSAVWDTEPSNPPYSGTWVEALTVPGGEEAGIRWRISWKDEDGTTRTIGNTHYTARIDEHLTELILPLDAGLPANDGVTWFALSGGQLQPGTANVLQDWRTPIPMPEGVVVEEFEARVFRDATHDIASVRLIRGNIDGLATTLVTLTGATGGWSTQVNTAVSETVTNPNSYHADLQLRGVDLVADARCAWVKVKYCRFTQQQAY